MPRLLPDARRRARGTVGDNLTDSIGLADETGATTVDTDGDTLTDRAEVNEHFTDPASNDTDGDDGSDGDDDGSDGDLDGTFQKIAAGEEVTDGELMDLERLVLRDLDRFLATAEDVEIDRRATYESNETLSKIDRAGGKMRGNCFFRRCEGGNRRWAHRFRLGFNSSRPTRLFHVRFSSALWVVGFLSLSLLGYQQSS